MKDYHLNLIDGIQPLNKSSEPSEPSISNKTARQPKIGRFFLKAAIVILVVIIVLYTNTIFAAEGVIGGVGRLSFWEGIARLALGKDKVLKGEFNDRVNIVILGMGGADHEGPYLTDTIMLVSLKPSTRDVALFSIPRDLYVPTNSFGWQKINAINSLGAMRSRDGVSLTSKTISDIFDTPIHYWLRIDFSAFKDLVDWLDGIDINIERSFIDNQYPAPNYNFKVVNFEAGPQTLNGEKTLQFVRSRHGNNNEGNDFARMKRQQKVLLAIKQKLEQKNSLTSPSKLWEIYNIFNKKITTNLDFSEMVRVTKLFANLQEEKIQHYTFDDSPDGLLYSEIATNGAYILRPKGGNFKKMAQVIQSAFIPNRQAQLNAISEPPTEPILKKNRLIILNGTAIAGLAQQTQIKLEELGYQIVRIGNAPQKNYENNMIYVSSNGQNNDDNLQKIFQTEISIIPNNLSSLLTNEADYLIILGKNNSQ